MVSVAALLIAFSVLITGNGLQMMLLPIRAENEGFSAVQLGLMGSAYYMGFVIGCLGTPIMLRQAGHVRVFSALAAATSAVALCYPMHVDATLWVPLRLVTGFCLAGLYLIVESWLNDRATANTRGALISIYVAINYAVTAAGQMTVTLLDTSSYMLFSVAAILFGISCFPLAMSRSPEPRPPERVRLRPLWLFRLSPSGTVTIFLIGLAAGTFWSLGPVFATDRSSDLTSAALFMSVAVLSGAVAQWPIGRLSDRVDRRHVLIGLSALGVAASVALAFLPDVGGGWLVFGVLFGATFLPAYAVASAHAFDYADRADYVEVSAGMLLLYGVGCTIGPLFASSCIELFGTLAVPAFIASMQALIIGFVALRLRARPAPAGKKVFDLGATAPVVSAGPVDDA